jgi:hypothetical protein
MAWLLPIYLYAVETYSAHALDNGCRSSVHFSVGAIGAALSSVVLIGRTDGLFGARSRPKRFLRLVSNAE